MCYTFQLIKKKLAYKNVSLCNSLKIGLIGETKVKMYYIEFELCVLHSYIYKFILAEIWNGNTINTGNSIQWIRLTPEQ